MCFAHLKTLQNHRHQAVTDRANLKKKTKIKKKRKQNKKKHKIINQTKNNKTMKLLIHSLKGVRAVESENIIYCEADGNHSKIYLNQLAEIDKKDHFVATKNLTQLTDLLPEIAFYRCYKKYLINFKYFLEFEVSTCSIIMANGEKIKIAREKKAESKEKLLKYFEKYS